MRRGEQAAAALLIAFILFMGLWPAPFIDRITETVSSHPGDRLDERALNFDWELLAPEFILGGLGGR